MKRNFIAKRFQSAGTGLTLDTAALAKYKDIVDLSIGDTDFITDDADAEINDVRIPGQRIGVQTQSGIGILKSLGDI